MTILVVEELKADPLTQTDTIRGGERLRLTAIRLHLMGFNAIASTPGSLQLNLVRDSITFETITQSIATIKAGIDTALGTSHPHWHGYVNFELPAPVALEEGTEWSMELSGIGGYTFDESSYIAWVKPHEDLPNSLNGSPSNFTLNPYGYQFFQWTKRVR